MMNYVIREGRDLGSLKAPLLLLRDVLITVVTVSRMLCRRIENRHRDTPE
jgi:hypothetical protein